MKIDIEATAEELDEIGPGAQHLPDLIVDALDRRLSLPGYNVTVNAGAALTAELAAAKEFARSTGDLMITWRDQAAKNGTELAAARALLREVLDMNEDNALVNFAGRPSSRFDDVADRIETLLDGTK